MTAASSRRALFIRLVAMAALVIGQMVLSDRHIASAAPGDVIADVVTPEGAVLGKGIAFDGRYLYYTLLNGTVLHRIDVPTRGGTTQATGHTEFAITGAPSGINAMSYDATRDMFWAAGGDGVSIYLLSKTGVATLRFAIDPAEDRPGDCKWQTCSQEINGLAYDGADDSLWYSPDATARVYHYHSFPDASGTAVLVQGSPYVDIDIAPNDMDGQCDYSLASGVAVGGEHLFIAGGGCRYLFEYTKAGAKIGWIQWAYGSQSPWELECDNLSYGASVFWAKDGFDGHIRAIEQPAGGCAYGGVASVPTVRRLKVTAPATVTAGQPFSVTITAENAQGNLVPTYNGAVHFATTDPSPLVQLPSDSTLTNGQGTFSVTLIQGEAQTLTVSDTANSLSTAVSLLVNAQAATGFSIRDSGDPSDPHVAGSPITFALQAKDRYGNTDLAYAGTLHFTSSDSSAGVVLPADATLTNGQGSFSATLTQAGAQTITATDTTTASITGTMTANVRAAAATRLQLATAATTPTAGTAIAFTVAALDQFGNTDTAYAGRVRFTSSDSSAGVVLPADSTLTNGQGSFSATLTKAGPQTIRGTDTTSSSLSGTISVNVRAAAASRLQLATAATTPTAGTAISFTVAALDQFGNTDLAYGGTLHFTSSDTSAGVVLPADATLANGQGAFSATLTRAGTQTITATDTTISGMLSVSVKPDVAAAMTITAPASVKMTQPFNLTVTLKDRFGNVATGYGGTVHFTTSDISPLVSLPPDYAFKTADAGVHSFSVTLQTPPSQTVTATDVATAALRATSAPIAVTLPLP